MVREIMQQNDYSQDQPIWNAPGHDITIRWREKYGWKPASELPEIKAKHEFFRLRQYENKGANQ
jgi:hypothetical protein